MQVLNLGTVFIYVTNLEDSIGFYTNVFGLVSRGIEDWGNGERGATLFFSNPDGKPMVTLAETESTEGSEKPLFSLQCSGVENLHKKIKDYGYNTTNLIQWESEWNNHILFDVSDADGNTINLCEIISKQ